MWVQMQWMMPGMLPKCICKCPEDSTGVSGALHACAACLGGNCSGKVEAELDTDVTGGFAGSKSGRRFASGLRSQRRPTAISRLLAW